MAYNRRLFVNDFNDIINEVGGIRTTAALIAYCTAKNYNICQYYDVQSVLPGDNVDLAAYIIAARAAGVDGHIAVGSQSPNVQGKVTTYNSWVNGGGAAAGARFQGKPYNDGINAEDYVEWYTWAGVGTWTRVGNAFTVSFPSRPGNAYPNGAIVQITATSDAAATGPALSNITITGGTTDTFTFNGNAAGALTGTITVQPDSGRVYRFDALIAQMNSNQIWANAGGLYVGMAAETYIGWFSPTAQSATQALALVDKASYYLSGERMISLPIGCIPTSVYRAIDPTGGGAAVTAAINDYTSYLTSRCQYLADNAKMLGKRIFISPIISAEAIFQGAWLGGVNDPEWLFNNVILPAWTNVQTNINGATGNGAMLILDGYTVFKYTDIITLCP